MQTDTIPVSNHNVTTLFSPANADSSQILESGLSGSFCKVDRVENAKHVLPSPRNNASLVHPISHADKIRTKVLGESENKIHSDVVSKLGNISRLSNNTRASTKHGHIKWMEKLETLNRRVHITTASFVACSILAFFLLVGYSIELAGSSQRYSEQQRDVWAEDNFPNPIFLVGRLGILYAGIIWLWWMGGPWNVCLQATSHDSKVETT
mmetsp:Transcript_17276/g.24177  ORF Transcript_17276/g.24177 Transcript_17276/m.24177 type:complete len:209 (-) Transcript_17276:321-947(-)